MVDLQKNAPPPPQKKKKKKKWQECKSNLPNWYTGGKFQQITFRTKRIYFLRIQIVTIHTNLLASPQNFDTLQKLS